MTRSSCTSAAKGLQQLGGTYICCKEMLPDAGKHTISKLAVLSSTYTLACRILVSQPKNSAQPVFALADNEALTDTYMGITLLWTHYVQQRSTNVISYDQTASEDIHSFRLRVHHKRKHIIEQYLQHVRQEAAVMEKKGRELLVSFALHCFRCHAQDMHA